MIHLFFIRPNIIQSDLKQHGKLKQYSTQFIERKFREKKQNIRPKFVGTTWKNIVRRLLQIKKKEKNNDEFLGYVIYVKSCIFLSWINMLPFVMSGVLYVFALFFCCPFYSKR